MQIKKPMGIATLNNSVFICDAKANEIVVLDENLNRMGKLGALGIKQGEFVFPTNIKTRDDNLYVLDSGNNRVQVFSSKYDFIKEHKVVNAKDEYNAIMMNAKRDTAIVFSIGFFSLAFSMLNFVMIILGKITDKKKSIAVNLALRASKLDIFWGIFVENFIIGAFATLFSLVIGGFCVNYFTAFSNSIFDAFVCLSTSGLCLIIMVLISGIATKNITRSSVSSLLNT